MTLARTVLVAYLLGLVTGTACHFANDRSLGTIDEVRGAGGGSSSGASADPLSGAGVGSSSPQINVGGYHAAGLEQLPRCALSGEEAVCGAGQFCSLDLDCARGASVAVGVCRTLPESCDTPSRFETVCGCDGQFYESRCIAEQQGISVSNLSGCEPRPCLSKSDCEQFAFSCIDNFGVSVRGVVCNDRACACGGLDIVL